MNTSNPLEKKREYWIDMAKAFAIIAVLLDHTFGYLYTNPKILFCSFYSVGLFIYIFGVTSYLSYKNYTGSITDKLKKSLWKIVRPYLVATFIFSIYSDRMFDWNTFFDRLIHFNARLPFYYVLLYIQLALVIPIFLYFFDIIDSRKNKILYELTALIVIVLLSVFTTNRTNIAGIYGGGGKLFGGTYLILLYLGMLFGKYKECMTDKLSVLIPLLIMSVILTIGWVYFISRDLFNFDSYFPFGYGLNPPGVSLVVYALLLVLVLFLAERVMVHNVVLNSIYVMCSRFGKHTLYIFLYHWFFLGGGTKYILEKIGIQVDNILMEKSIVIISMLIGPLILELIFERIHIILVKAYGVREKEG